MPIQLFLYLLPFKLKAMLRSPLSLLMYAGTLLNALAFSLILPLLLEKLDASAVKSVIFGVSTAFIFIKDLMPLRNYQRLMPRYYPISSYSYLWIELLLEIISPLVLSAVALAVVFAWKASIVQGAVLFIGALGVALCNLGIHHLMAYTGKGHKALLGLHIAIIAGYIGLQYAPLSLELPLALGLTLLAFGLRMATIRQIGQALRPEMASAITQRSISPLSVFLQNKSIRAPFLVGIVFKTALLLGNLATLQKKGEYLFNVQLLFILALSPTVLFTYVLNNTYGFLSGVYVLLQRAGRTWAIIGHLLSFFAVPLAIDAVITAFLLWKYNAVTEANVLLYLKMLLLLVGAGLVISLYLPVRVAKKLDFSYKTSTSQIGTMLLLPALFALYKGYDVVLYPYFALLLLAIGAFLWHEPIRNWVFRYFYRKTKA